MGKFGDNLVAVEVGGAGSYANFANWRELGRVE